MTDFKIENRIPFVIVDFPPGSWAPLLRKILQGSVGLPR